MLPVQGDRSPSLFLITDANERFSRFSPNGRFVAFVSDDSGRDEVFVLPFPGPREKLTISPADLASVVEVAVTEKLKRLASC